MAAAVAPGAASGTSNLTPVQRWTNHIAAYDREFKTWMGRSEKIIKRYRDEKRAAGDSGSRFNILWSNVQTLTPATFSRLPMPEVSRRFRDNDPVGRVAALIVERGLDYEVQHYPDYRNSLAQAVQDRFLGGRGTAWVRYEPKIEGAAEQVTEDSADQPDQPGPAAGAPPGAEPPAEAVTDECVPVDYVHWRDFGHTIARTWEEVTAVWRVVYMARPALVARFGKDLGGKIALDAKPEELTRTQTAGEAEFSRAKIYEIWDISTKTAVWLSKSQPDLLDERADPLELDGFWPCPRPLYSTLTNDSLVPVPDFTIYQDQQATLDTLAERIARLVQALQVKGVYDASQGLDLARLFTEGENTTLLPMKNWAAFAEKNGLQGAISLVDLKPIAEALREAYMAMEQVKNQVYELTGISDIVRGQGEAHETATAQRLKGQYASLRLKAYQEEVARFATSLLQIKAQIMCSKFSAETLAQIAAVEQLTAEDKALVPQALALLKNNVLRNFRVEIAADTLVQVDEQTEKESRAEFLTAVGGFLQKSMPMVEAAAQQGATPLVGLIFELLKFGVTGYKVGKTIEGKFDASLDQLQKMLSQPRPPQPNPEMARVEAEKQSQALRVQADRENTQAKLAADQQAKQFERQMNMQQAQFEANLKAHSEAQQRAFEQWEAKLKADTAIAVAQISANASIKTSAMSANAGADPLNGGEVSETGEAQPKQSLADLVNASNENFQQLIQGMSAITQGHQTLVESMNRPKQLTLPDGRVARLQ